MVLLFRTVAVCGHVVGILGAFEVRLVVVVPGMRWILHERACIGGGL